MYAQLQAPSPFTPGWGALKCLRLSLPGRFPSLLTSGPPGCRETEAYFWFTPEYGVGSSVNQAQGFLSRQLVMGAPWRHEVMGSQTVCDLVDFNFLETLLHNSGASEAWDQPRVGCLAPCPAPGTAALHSPSAKPDFV